MLIGDNKADLSLVVTSELREIYGIKYRKEKNHQKVLQVTFKNKRLFYFQKS